jgi:Ca-activated chloride channel family protein
MHADDLKPTRLEYAKTVLKELINSNHKDRFAIIAFTTNAIILSPLSDDSELLLHLFSGLDEQMIMTKGTAIMPMLKLARKMSKSKNPRVLIFSDGGDAQEYDKEAQYALKNGLHVSIMMLASERGATIKEDNGDLLKDEKGNIVVSRANEAIKALSNFTKGRYLKEPDASDVIKLVSEQENHDFESEKKVMQYRELFYIFITLALISSLLAFTTLSLHVMKRIAPFLLIFGITLEATSTDAKLKYNQAGMFYKQGQYEKALNLYRAVKSSEANFKYKVYYNMGNCLIRLKEYNKAREMFVKSLTLVDDIQARENLLAIFYAQEQDHMITGRQKGKKREQDSSAKNSSKNKKKEGGSSNMDVSADSSNGAGDDGKKVKSEARLNFSKSKSKLSSKQYELINQRSVYETKPW